MNDLQKFITAYKACEKNLAIMRTVHINYKKHHKLSNRLWTLICLLSTIIAYCVGKFF